MTPSLQLTETNGGHTLGKGDLKEMQDQGAEAEGLQSRLTGSITGLSYYKEKKKKTVELIF